MGVNKATDKLFPVANTPEAILALGVDGLKEYIKTIGLFNSKAENVIKTCRILIEKHGGQVPERREDLEAVRASGVQRIRATDSIAHETSDIPLHELLLVPLREELSR